MRLAFCLLISILFLACSNSEGVSVPQQGASVDIAEDSLSGMFRIKAVGATVVLGTNVEEAPANERPEMQVNLMP